ncbi:MAG: carbohydrate binding family 9 domain-containing protein, partial [Polaribacter sp.]|nr:carbohydrate binding family 9 domain-containing protein [Polaribacter sp.]
MYIAFSQNTTNNKASLQKRIYTTKPLIKTPIIDGVVDDEAWNVVEWSSDFTQKDPDEGKPPTYQTMFKVMYDAKYLYIAIRAFDDEPNKIESRLSRRDGFQGDRVNVIIDSYHDKRTAFVFTTTAAGVKGEEFVSQNGDNWDESWNPIWYTNAKIDDKGWTAEMKIPFSQLRFGKAKEQIWGFNINRTIFRLQERSLWQRIPNDQAGFISEAGELHGLKDLVSQKQLEIQPFTVFQYDKYPPEVGNPFRTGSDFIFNAGLDAKIGITNDLTLDLTVNPDFGQVEADPGAIALDGFQIFFREQRPFFVENSNIFDYQFANGSDNVFYSRRIGRNPHRSANLAAGEFADEPLNSRILGAAKFSGKT